MLYARHPSESWDPAFDVGMATPPTQFEQVWYGDAKPPLSWRLVESLYTGITSLRRRLYRNGTLRSHRIARPVVVVGNV
ncbi:MAG TPA: tetraacyldisaccharide 4'-kinase, partial [Tahibacter sp.]|nr:tetraacyldisaccharide 4'-kinase [Tahibacter sp.]